MALSERFLDMVSKLTLEEMHCLVWYYAAQSTLGGDGTSHEEHVCEVLKEDIETMRESVRGNDGLTRGDA